LKEEGQTQKKLINNFTSSQTEEKPRIIQPNNDFLKKNVANTESQKNFKTEDTKNNEIPKRITPMKKENPKDDKYLSRKSNNEDEKELAGYSQIVPGLFHIDFDLI